MKFILSIATKKGFAIKIKNQHNVGFEKLDFARKVLNIDFDAKFLIDKIREKNIDPVFEITEKVARESQLFQHSCLAKIIVPNQFLNQFTEEVVNANVDFATNEIESVKIENRFNEELFLDWWKENNYPSVVVASDTPLTSKERLV